LKFKGDLGSRAGIIMEREMITTCIIFPLPLSCIPNFMYYLIFLVILGSIFGHTDGLTGRETVRLADGRTEGKPIVPFGVNTGRGLFKMYLR